MKILKTYWPLFLTFLLAVFVFLPVFSLYFAQDDFFHLKMGMAEGVKDVFLFFSFKNPYGYTFYRPLTTQVYTFAVRSFFGLNPFFFRLTSFSFFLLNLYLVFKIVAALTKNKNLGFLASFLYAFNASNLGSLAYMAAFQEIGVAFFFFLTFFLYLKDKKLAVLTFVLALLSKETAAVLPAVLVIYEFLLGERKLKKTLPFWFILALYVLFRLASGLPESLVYEMNFSPIKILNGYLWYFLWGLGIPEMLIDFVGPGFKINPNFLIWFYRPSQIIFIASFLFLLLLGMAIFRSRGQDKKTDAFFTAWFLVTLLPVIFWPWHRFSYYLTVPLLGLVGLFAALLKNLPKALIFLAVLLLFAVSITTVRISQETYWVIARAKIAENLISDLKSQYPQLPKAAALYFQNDPEYPMILGFGNSSTQAYYALSGENGPQVIYDDFTLQVYYEDLEKPPSPPASGEIFPIVAKIRQE